MVNGIMGGPGRGRAGREPYRAAGRRRRAVLASMAAVLAMLAAACDPGGGDTAGGGGSLAGPDGTGGAALAGDGSAVPGAGAGAELPGPPVHSGEDGAGHETGSAHAGGVALGAGAGVSPVGQPSATADLSAVGRWSDPSTWPGGRVPAAGEHVTIAAGRQVKLDTGVEVSGLEILGELYFDPATSATLTSDANIVVNGLLHLKPASPAVDHTITFAGVDEGAFVGGGMEPVDSDVGLWVVGGGQLIAEGSPRRGWSTATAAVDRGATTVEVGDATGWAVGDEIALAPTAAPGQDGIAGDDAALTSGFHETTIAAIDGNRVTLADPPPGAHPLVAGRYGPEVMNLTRNVTIQGTEAGRSHVFIHTNDKPQFVRWTSLERLGVGSALGRYPIHVHHAGTSAAGSLIEGTVVRDGGHHAFVPHESHGITMRDLVAYGVTGGDAYWWDEGDRTHDLVWDHVLAAGTSNSGFFLGRGTNMTIRDAVAVGVQNRFNDGGFEWENVSAGNWRAENLVAHNNAGNGIRVWQNSDIPQVVDGYVAYHNHRAAIDHGAYTNRYVYRNAHLYGNLENGVVLHATSDATQISFEHVVVDTAGITRGAFVALAAANIPATKPVLFRDVEFTGPASGPVFDFTTDTQHQIRCVDCSWPAGAELVAFRAGGAPESTWLEVVTPSASTRHVPGGGAVDVARPVPAAYGTGSGLTVEYFDGTDLTGPVYATVLPATTDLWELESQNPLAGLLPYHQLGVEDGSSARWTGEIEVAPGDGGEHTFATAFGGGLRLWVGGRLLIDDWANTNRDGGFDDPFSAGYNTATVDLAAGRHEVKMEVVHRPDGDDGYLGYFLDVYWQSGGRPPEIIPASQLHAAGPVPNNDPVPATPPK